MTEFAPPRVGAVYMAHRSRSGRRWRVGSIDVRFKEVVLVPIGTDVKRARSARTGKWQGGVRSKRVGFAELCSRWVSVADV